MISSATWLRRVTREKTMKANRRNVRRGVFPGPLPFFARQGEGKVAEHWANRDDLGMGEQLGWTPPTPVYLVRMLVGTRRARRAERVSSTRMP